MDKKRQKPLADFVDDVLPDDLLARMRPATEIAPDIVAAYERGDLQNSPAGRFRGPQKKPTKLQTTIRLDEDLIGYFKKGGKGWQTRLNDVLRGAVFGQGSGGRGQGSEEI